MYPIRPVSETLLADTCTPAGIYLRLRDRFPGALLLESADARTGHNSFSFICIRPVAGLVLEGETIQYQWPDGSRETRPLAGELSTVLTDFLNAFPVEGGTPVKGTAGLFGYTGFGAARFMDNMAARQEEEGIPPMRYHLYQYVIAIDHLRNALHLCENQLDGHPSARAVLRALILHRDIPAWTFRAAGEETSSSTDDAFRAMVEQGKAHCRRGDVFQVVLSRRFQQAFTGDEFNVYRALRFVNPSPYLFYFDYGDYRLFGSSPEAQVVLGGGKARLHPIAGTVRRTGDEAQDEALAQQLIADPKENAEHVMLVDLARNDLSRCAAEVQVDSFREVHRYSHVIHLVSSVSGRIRAGETPFGVLAATFPAGTLSGAPKHRAMELIAQYEPVARNWYGGAIGFAGFDGSLNHAILIRSFCSRNHTLHYQAGAGVVAHSSAEGELQEVHHKLNALREAIRMASTL